MTGTEFELVQEILINTCKHLLALLLCLAMSACMSNPASLEPASIVTDETFGHYHENLEPNLILITMTPKHHAFLTGKRSVPMSGELPQRYSDFLDHMQSRYGLTRVANWPLPAIDIFCIVFQIEDSQARETLVAALEKEPGVETAQIVQTFEVQAQRYNDPYLSLQHGLHSIQTIRSHQWSRGKGVVVAVIDTGMDNTHPDLMVKGDATRNFVDSNAAGFRSDTHGTAVGGVIAANADNQAGIVGIAPEASLLALKACWQVDKDASKARCNSLTLAKAIDYSIQQKVDIINLSLTGPPDPVLERLVLTALANNIVVTGARPAHEQKAFPVSISGTIAVAMPGNTARSLSAPGRRVISTLPDNQYDFFDGSSFSTAHMTGLIALLRSLSPSLSPDKVLALLELSADADTGVVNACRAVDMARRLDAEISDNDHCLLTEP